MVRFQINNKWVEIDDGELSAQRPELAELLRDHLTLYPSPGPADPDPDRLQAERLIADFGGEILSADHPPDYDLNAIY